MAVGVRTGSIVSEVGSSDFLNSFFSTVQGLLEPNGSGTKFPMISKEFYEGRIPSEKVIPALEELKEIREELGKYPPSAAIWDIEDRTKQPPWGDDISSDITSMANYFVTSTGRDLLEMLIEDFEYASSKGYERTIEQY